MTQGKDQQCPGLPRIPRACIAIATVVTVLALGAWPALSQQKYTEVRAHQYQYNGKLNLVMFGYEGSDLESGEFWGFFQVMFSAPWRYLGAGLTAVEGRRRNIPWQDGTPMVWDAVIPEVVLQLPLRTQGLLGTGARVRLFRAWKEQGPDAKPIEAHPGLDIFAQFDLTIGRPEGSNTSAYGASFSPLSIEVGYFWEDSFDYDDPLDEYGLWKHWNPSTTYARVRLNFGALIFKHAVDIHKVPTFNPSVSVSSSLDSGIRDIAEGETIALRIHVDNKGPGMAEDLRLKLTTEGRGADHLTISNPGACGDLGSGESRDITVEIAAEAGVAQAENVSIHIECLEKDGFNAEDTILLAVLPEMAREQFPPDLSVEAILEEPSGNDLLDALEHATIVVTVKNSGRGNAWNLIPEVSLSGEDVVKHVTLEGPQPVRRLRPEESTRISIPISADWDLPDSRATLDFRLREGNGFDASPLRFSFGTQAFLEPKLVVVKTGIDDSEGERTTGDGDNVIENRETVEVTVLVQNRGQGTAKGVTASVQSADDNVNYYGDDLYFLGDLEPGEMEHITFRILVNDRYDGPTDLPVSLELVEHYRKFGFERRSLGLALNEVALATQEFDIPGRRHKKVVIPGPETFAVDVDENIPDGEVANPNAVAVVIGNRDYEHENVPKVEYAWQDARVFCKYLESCFGLRRGNIIYEQDATAGDLLRIFGTREKPRGQLTNLVKPGESDVFVYYSGHGAPDPEEERWELRGYLVPKDCDPDYVSTNGYSLDLLYDNLAELHARSVTVIIDACFSGLYDRGSLLSGISPLGFEVETPQAAIPNGTIVSSSRMNEVSCWYEDKRHGLFTYYFLKALGGEADRNSDKAITTAELEDYLLEHVPYQARLLKNKEQHPQIRGDRSRVWIRLK